MQHVIFAGGVVVLFSNLSDGITEYTLYSSRFHLKLTSAEKNPLCSVFLPADAHIQ